MDPADDEEIVVERRSTRLVGIVVTLTLTFVLAGCDLAAISRINPAYEYGAPGVHRQHGGDVSDDGEIVVFTSEQVYDDEDTNGLADVIVADRNLGIQVRVSASIGGGAPNATAWDAAVSGNGRYVTWRSDASDVIAGDTNGVADVFRIDLETGITERVSVRSNGVQGDRPSRSASMSDDGRLVAFSSSASLIAGDVNTNEDVYVRDMDTGTTTRWSVRADGSELAGPSYHPHISGDGRSVAFASINPFDPGDGNGVPDVYLKAGDGPITWVSAPVGGKAPDGSSVEPAVNQDGTVVAFLSGATTFDPADGNGEDDVFVWEAGTVELVSASPHGVVGSGQAWAPSVDDSGNLVGFSSDSPELTDGAPDTQSLVRNRQERHTDLVSSSLTGEGGTDDDTLEAISGDGRSVVIRALSDNLVPDTIGSGSDILVKAYPFPRVTRTTPNVLAPGTTTTVTIEGKGFSGPLYVSLSANAGAALALSPPIPLSPTRIRLNVTVPAGAALQAHDLRVWNLGDHPDNAGAETTCYSCLQVG